MNVYGAYSTVAGVCALGSVALGLGIFMILRQITDSGMWAIAAMVAAPAIMGICISFFVFLSHNTQKSRDPERPLPPDDAYGSGSFTTTGR